MRRSLCDPLFVIADAGGGNIGPPPARKHLTRTPGLFCNGNISLGNGESNELKIFRFENAEVIYSNYHSR